MVKSSNFCFRAPDVYVQVPNYCELCSTASVTICSSSQRLEPEDSMNQTKIFPNPTTNEFTIESLSTISKVIIFDMHGKIMTETTPQENLFQINVNKYAEGIYFLKIWIENGKIENHKLMISK